MGDRHSEFIERLLSSKHAEALAWLRGGRKNFTRNLGIMEPKESVELVQRLYKLGAVKVTAVEIDEYDEGENTGHLVVQLPSEPAKRRELFEAERATAESQGFDGVGDTGQEHVFLKLD